MGMFGGKKSGGGFDWKAAAIAFANPEAGLRYAERRDQLAQQAEQQARQQSQLKTLMDAISNDPSLSPQDRAYAMSNPNAYIEARMKAMVPSNNDTANDWRFYQQNLSPEEFQQWKTNSVIDRPVIVQGPNGPIAVRPSELGAAGGSRPPIGSTIPDPRRQGGAGSAASPLPFRPSF